jgi:RHS repeat-associated protein
VKEAAERLIPQGATASMSNLNLPNTLHEIMLPDSSRQMILSDEISSYPGAVILDTMELRSPFEQIALLNDSGEYTIYSLYRLSGVDPSLPPTMPSGDPFLIPMDKAEDPPYPDLVYYIHDHLGNARVLYHVTLACGEGPDPLDYYADHLVDYRPFGSILREYLPEVVPEKFLTTHHERDVQTGLDYRGARFYDSDLGRFLSVDPLAAKRSWVSPYNYVQNNPVLRVDPTGALDHNITINEEGEVIDIEENDQPHRLFMQRRNGSKHEVIFNDPDIDRDQLGMTDIGQILVHFLTPENVNYIMNDAGVTSFLGRTLGIVPELPSLTAAGIQSIGGVMDFGFSSLVPQLVAASGSEEGYNVPLDQSSPYSHWDNAGGFIFFYG